MASPTHALPPIIAMPIHHTVLLKLKQGVSLADIEKVKSSLFSLPSKIPAFTSAKAGKTIPHALDHGFDTGVIFEFKDEDALMNGYMPHKAHTDYAEETAQYIEGQSCIQPTST
ncbi:hypothetical protein HYDPIDRAFT_28435 [Hydnomerulius pinastri MD-312]|uniref:Stress-response A/B barrel domain-containing protein n=1 Tax=Hydnomerulius pinastri MD-312 TaxID=994086 RepID=A0A0C9VFZ0_9AGAM|nr:hypothetical protein HYDPIDRAFT_28435 [Hydnomerulius pinastri MD-312]